MPLGFSDVVQDHAGQSLRVREWSAAEAKRSGLVDAESRASFDLRSTAVQIVAVVLVVGPVAWLVALVLPTVPVWVRVMISVVVSVWVTAVVQRLFRGATRRKLIQKCLGAGSCPVCQYELSAIVAGEDGLVPCPECGARWRGVGTVE